MQVLFYIIRKEFLQIIRDKAMLPMMTIMPLVQLMVLSNAASNEIKRVNLHVEDMDKSQFSQRLIEKIQANDIFHIVSSSENADASFQSFMDGSADIILRIPNNAERDFLRSKSTEVQLLIDAINGQAATVGFGYLNNIIRSFNKEMRSEVSLTTPGKNGSLITIEYSNWYNPELNYKHFMVPGILGELVIILVLVLTAMNIVKEREVGTIEQINVTPIKKWQFILGKMIPFLFVGLMLMAVGLTLGKLIFDVPIVGSLWTVFAYVLICLVAVLGMGLLLSNFADTQQQAIFLAFFFVIIFVLLCGLFTPIESMPPWAQKITIPNPLAHFVAVMRNVLLKGSTMADMSWRFIITGILAVVFNTLAVLTYKKTV
jgi:ABC-2 type transport system permease protein